MVICMINGYQVVDGVIKNIATFNNVNELFEGYVTLNDAQNPVIGDFYIEGAVIKNLGPEYGFIDGQYQISPEGLVKLKDTKAKELKAERQKLELAPINGISVEKSAHREDIEKYADVLALYNEASQEEQEQYVDMLNADGSINWTLADDTVRPVTEMELRQTLLAFLIRKATLMRQYQIALNQLKTFTTLEEIRAITLEVSNV